ncbi:MAG TPA: hypothetical protein PKA82_01340 [Pyrinomonadaceae bacterium]|nr:hypothetical protein [Pyrinomonadaceae bacterium]
MTALFDEAADLQNFIEENGWDFYFVGGVAVQFWGEPRLTYDLDLTVFTDLSNESDFIKKFLEKYRPKFHDADEFALTNRVLPLWTASNTGIDVNLAGFSDLSNTFARSSYQKLTDTISLRVCSAEDLLIMKTIAGRPKDWLDAESIIIKQSELDWSYVDSSLSELELYPDIKDHVDHLHGLKEIFFRK